MNAQDTSAEPRSDLPLQIAHLLLIDVVGYSKLLVNEQIELLQELNQIVRGTECFRAAEAAGKLIRVPTGDGMALLFFRSPEEPVRCALEVSRALQDHSRIQVRMGVHSGPVNRVIDVTDKTNFAGAGINVAQRVLDCGDAGHILLSKHVAEDLAPYRHWEPYLRDLGECENQAVSRAPSFLQAYCQLASAHDYFYVLGFDHTPGRLALAEAAIQAAFRLRPDAGEVHLARAENFYRGYQDYRGALAELEVARQTLPNDARVFQLMGFIQRRQGHWEEATQNLERTVELDPRSTDTLQQMAWQYLFVRRYAEVKPLLNRVLAIESNRVDTVVLLASVDFHWKADIRPFHQMIDSIRTTNAAALPAIADAWLTCALAERDPGAVANVIETVDENGFGDDTVQFSRTFVEGLVARMIQDDGKARSAFTAARSEQEKIAQAQPDYAPPLCVLGLIDAALARKEEALREGRRAVELLPVEKDAINGVRMIKYLAMIAAWSGDKNLACEQLTIALRHPTAPSYGELKLLPFWDRLRGDPRFEKIVASLAPKGTKEQPCLC